MPASAAAPPHRQQGCISLLNSPDSLREKGVGVGFVTLHVGLGTFRPVKAENVEDHHMHSEHYMLPEATAKLINDTKKNDGRVFCRGNYSLPHARKRRD